MNNEKYNYFTMCKEYINQLISCAVRNDGIVPRGIYEKCLVDNLLPNTPNVENIFYNKLLVYEKVDTEEKLRALYNEIDGEEAKIAIETKIEETILDDSTEEVDKTAFIIEYFISKGIEEKNVKTAESLADYIQITSSLSLDYLSRGQKNYSWPLLPSALRKGKDNQNLYSKDDVDWMIQEFKRVLKYYDKSFDKKMDLELESYAQHYAIPTNLIDFTEAHILSLLFALEEYESSEYAIVYFVDAMEYNTNVCFRGKRRPIPNCSEEDCNAGAASVFIKSDSVNERIHFQKGYFLRVPENYAKDDILEDLSPYTKAVLIAPENKENILSELFAIGITFQNIYPDLNNLSSSIKFRNKIKQRGELDE